ncbi:MAG: tyrosine-type recombinase/integrase [Candidatus Geothermincolales bacterium]
MGGYKPSRPQDKRGEVIPPRIQGDRLKDRLLKRAVPIPEPLAGILEERYRRLGFPPPEALVFPSRRGNYRDPSHFLADEFLPALERAGLPRIRFHDLRHTYASLAIEGGANLKGLQAVMGHSSLAVTAGTYAHLYETALERVSKGVENALSGGPKVVHMPKRKEGGR